ncbi:MAG: flagellar biosynthesis anti-sigma factor FlgM [Lachnospiraceae bacterium]|nr:flagellar biosynthesis anti-sigma factor FlgM [Lachnospiraceae bacterium]
MRIDAYAQVQQLYGSKKTRKVQNEARSTFKDQLQISSKGKDFQVAKNAVASAPDVREEVIAPLKKQINAGTYEVNGDQFAQKLFEKYNKSQLGSF